MNSRRLQRFSSLMCLALMLAVLSACGGYQFAPDSPSIFGDGSKTIKVKGVDYPTLQPWLPHALRSSLRDELAARHMAVWVDSGPADYEIQIKVLSFTSREWFNADTNIPAIYDNRLTLEAIVYQGDTNRVVWRSGAISYSDHEENPSEYSGSGDIITQTMRLLIDKMRNAF